MPQLKFLRDEDIDNLVYIYYVKKACLNQNFSFCEGEKMKNKGLLSILILTAFSFASICTADTDNVNQNETINNTEAKIENKENTASIGGNLLSIKINDNISLEMIECPAGSFMMGTLKGELGRDPERETQHKVTISNSFYIGKYEVTQEQYEAVMGDNPSEKKGAKLPVEKLRWLDAIEFCKKLNNITANARPLGYKFDLPTEAQWEYACRAGTTTSLNSGKDISDVKKACPNADEVAWYKFNSEKTSHNVGQKKPNAWGIYDMHGNVWEFCRDTFVKKLDLTKEVDPITLDDTKVHICIRGGGYYCRPIALRAGSRDSETKTYPHKFHGFRVALVYSE